jgi:hypothetical protein
MLSCVFLTLIGCAITTPVQPVASSISEFDSAVYPGVTDIISQTQKGVEEYRVFHQGATGLASMQSIRSSVEQRAFEFCSGKGKTMKPLRETLAQPPFLFGNFPRIELVFACI